MCLFTLVASMLVSCGSPNLVHSLIEPYTESTESFLIYKGPSTQYITVIAFLSIKDIHLHVHVYTLAQIDYSIICISSWLAISICQILCTHSVIVCCQLFCLWNYFVLIFKARIVIIVKCLYMYVRNSLCTCTCHCNVTYHCFYYVYESQ